MKLINSGTICPQAIQPRNTRPELRLITELALIRTIPGILLLGGIGRDPA